MSDYDSPLDSADAPEHYVSSLTVDDLWGQRSFQIDFFDDVNVIIGPNASGKTTLIDILYDSLSGNLPRLSRTYFSAVSVTLTPFRNGTTRVLRISRSERKFDVQLGEHEYSIPLAPFFRFTDELDYIDERRFVLDRRNVMKRFQRAIRQLAPAVWLPVSRRLPAAEDEDTQRKRRSNRPLESVDECLSELTEELQKYRLSLNAELSELRFEFQRHALENILYDKQHDAELTDLGSFTRTSPEDEQSLLKAFRDVGLADQSLDVRIREHFAAASDAYAKLESGKASFEEVLIIPLINRTRSIIGFAQELEKKRGELFSSLDSYQEIVNSFVNNKHIHVSDQGELIITPNRPEAQPIEWRHLSSGEKQILILLTQALLSKRNPVIFVADEPELSLHVEWQEQLLSALTRLAGRCQFIVATHSPDIVSEFGDKVIDLARL